MYLEFDCYLDKTIPLEQFRKDMGNILGLPVFFIPGEVPQNLEDAVLIRLYKKYKYTGFSIEWDTQASPSGIANNFELAKHLAVELDTQVVTPYPDEDGWYLWYMYDQQGNLFLVDDDDDEDALYEQFLYETKRLTTLPLAKAASAA